MSNQTANAPAFSKETRVWVKSEFGPSAKVQGASVLLPMTQQEYEQGLAALLTKFDFFCPETALHVGLDWCASFRDGVLTLTLD